MILQSLTVEEITTTMFEVFAMFFIAATATIVYKVCKFLFVPKKVQDYYRTKKPGVYWL